MRVLGRSRTRTSFAQVVPLGVITLALAPLLSAQPTRPDPASLEAMRKLDRWVGHWKGQGWAEMFPGQRHEFTITETIQRKMDGLVLLVEGLGKDEDGAPTHNALAILSYDSGAKQHRFRSWRLPGGQFRDSEAKLTASGLEWGFQDPGGPHIRFTIQLKETGQWFETGELSRDGNTWRKFFEMTLERVK